MKRHDGNTIIVTGHSLDRFDNAYRLSLNCDLLSNTGDIALNVDQPPVPVDAQQVVLAVPPGTPAGDYHVKAVSSGSLVCSTDTIHVGP